MSLSSITEDLAKKGFDFCIINSKTLCEASNILAINNNNEAAYSLWSLAVEELGKAELIRDSKEGNQYNICKSWFKGGSHEKKFSKGLSSLKIASNIITKQTAVLTNKLDGQTKLSHLTVGSHQTGVFEESIPNDFKLRFSSLYVDFKDNQWIPPLENIDTIHFISTTTLNSEIIKGLISSLQETLEGKNW